MQVPHNLIKRLSALEATAKVLMDEATEIRLELGHVYGLEPRKGKQKGLSDAQLAKLKIDLEKSLQKKINQ